jgi:hypothetical protein
VKVIFCVVKETFFLENKTFFEVTLIFYEEKVT